MNQPTMADGLYTRHGKRVLDVASAGLALAMLAPVLALVWLLVRWQLGSPVLFLQRRVGQHGRPFTILKFRTMRNLLDAEGKPLPDDLRITTLGRYLRRYRLDELPEFINILRGDMSLVGPRPLLEEEMNAFPLTAPQRTAVRPGLTGWAQVNGNSILSDDDKLALDLWYKNNYSFTVDIKIILFTVGVIVFGERINQHRIDEARSRCELH